MLQLSKRRTVFWGLAVLFTAGCAASTIARRDRHRCDPPQISHYNGEFCCEEIQEQRSPASTAEAAAIVRDEILSGSRTIRVIGNAHTGNRSLCSKGLVIRVDHLKRIIGLEQVGAEQTVVAEAGVTVGELNRWLHERHVTLGSPTLEFRDATLGGAIANAAHGSTLVESSVISSSVRGLWIVTARDVEAAGEAYVEPAETTERTTDAMTWRALRANVGCLGMVTKVRLAVVPDYDLRVTVRYERDDLLWKGGGVEALMKGCDWGQIHWFARASRLVQLCGRRDDSGRDPDGANVLLDPIVSAKQLAMFISLMETMAKSRGWSCGIERLRYWSFKLDPPLRKRESATDDSLHASRVVVGSAWEMMSSVLTPMQANVPQNDFEIAVPMDHASELLFRLKAEILEHDICLPLAGVFLRFTRADDSSLLGHAVADGKRFKAGEGVMFVELVVYRPTGHRASAYDRYFSPYWRLVSRLIAYGGRPHWAKNAIQFFKQATTEPLYAERVRQFRAIARALDPHHRFATEFTDAVGLTEAAN